MQTNTYSAEKALPAKVDKVLAKSDKLLKAKDQLSSDFNTLVSDAEALLKSTASYSGETVNEARVKFQDTLDHLKGRVADVQTAALAKFDRAATATDTYVHDNPWKVVGVAAAVGLLLGVLLHKK